MPPATSAQSLRTPRKLNRRRAIADMQRGMSANQIAQTQGLACSTVTRFMLKVKPAAKAVEAFKNHRADIFARLQAKSLDVQERLFERLDGVVEAIDPKQIPGLILALNASSGTNFDKERLQRGQSTSNQSIISRLLDDSVKSLYRPVKQVIDSADSHTPE